MSAVLPTTPASETARRDEWRMHRLAFAVMVAFIAVAPAFIYPVFMMKVMCFALFACAFNLLIGFSGLLSFGQALYFGFGMYGAALSVLHWGAGFWSGLAAGVIAATLMAAIAGSLAVRLTWHYFAIITVVFSLIFYFAAMSAKPITGGDDGLSFSAPPVFDAFGLKLSLADVTTQYYVVLAVCALCYGLLWLVLRSPVGLRFEAIRENDRRARLIGINVYLCRLSAFVMAGAVAGLAGALFAFFGRYASASYMFYHVSGEATVWAIVGGSGTLLGPLFGTALLIVFRELVSTVWENYLFAVGALTVLVVMFAPRGLAGIWHDLIGFLTRGPTRESDTPPAAREPAP